MATVRCAGFLLVAVLGGCASPVERTASTRTLSYAASQEDSVALDDFLQRAGVWRASDRSANSRLAYFERGGRHGVFVDTWSVAPIPAGALEAPLAGEEILVHAGAPRVVSGKAEGVEGLSQVRSARVSCWREELTAECTLYPDFP